MHGGKDWEAGAYSPETNTLYYPLRNMCMPTLTTTDRSASHPYYALSVRHELAPGTENLGTVYAICAETGKTLWLHEQRASTTSLVATGGGLLFGGDVNGRFKAYSQETGEVPWEVNLGAPVTGYPITYAVDGTQYVAVRTGISATTSSFLRLTPELKPAMLSKMSATLSPRQRNRNATPARPGAISPPSSVRSRQAALSRREQAALSVRGSSDPLPPKAARSPGREATPLAGGQFHASPRRGTRRSAPRRRPGHVPPVLR